MIWSSNERIKKYLDAGTVLGQVTRARAEEIVRELVSAGDIQREQTQEWVDNLVERAARRASRSSTWSVTRWLEAAAARSTPPALETVGRAGVGSAQAVGRRRSERHRRRGGPGGQGRQGGPGGRREGDPVSGQEEGDQEGRDGQEGRAGQDGGREDRSGQKAAQEGRRRRRRPPTAKKAARGQEGTGRQEGRRRHAPPPTDHRNEAAEPRVPPAARPELVRRGLVANRHEAQEAIAAGPVLVAGTQADKAARLVAPDEPIVVQGPPGTVRQPGRPEARRRPRRDSPSHPEGRRALDAGASTGGFTDCLLQRGAAHVYAVDVGHGQLDQRLRNDSRVTVLEKVNVRTLTPEMLRERDPAFEPCLADHGRPVVHLAGHGGRRRCAGRSGAPTPSWCCW